MSAVLRWVSGLHITGAVPCALLEETADFVALFQPGGSVWKRAAGERSGPRGRNMLPSDRAGHVDRTWAGDGVLRIHRFGEEWSVWRWLDGSRLWSEHFYLNLEDPWRRTPIGFDSGDWLLDVVGTPHSWRYKDEDELAWSEEVGLVTAEWSQRTRAAGRRAASALEAGGWPFDTDWNRWLPPVDLAMPSLPVGWDKVEEPGTGV